jgi:hypothetical protein
VFLLTCASTLAVGSLSATAFAATVTNERPLLFSFDGSDTTAGRLSEVGRLDIDQVSGAVYVLDEGSNVIDKFDANGVASLFSGPGGSSLDGSGTPQGSFNVNDDDIAIDNSAVNQGRIHLLNATRVLAFGSSGGFLWQLAGGALDPPPACGIALDTEGDVWVGHYGEFKALEFDSTGSPPALIGSVSINNRLCRLNVDAAGNLYINKYEGGVDKYVGGVQAATLDFASTHDVAVDQSDLSGHIFTIHGTDFNEYESSGTLYKTFGTNLIGDGRGIAYNSNSDRVYVSDRASNTVKVFGPAASGTVPDVTTAASTEIGLHGAKFNGTINPLSLPNSYHFEWKEGEGASWGAARFQPMPYPTIEPTDSSEHAVAFTASGLKANTNYQVRLVGTNSENDLNSYSTPITFTTLAPPAPAVTIDDPASITTTSAEISGTVNPQGDATTWRLQTSTDPGCATGFTSKATHALGSEGTSPVAVSDELTDLLPNVRYCVRINAANAGGSTNSAVKVFTTDPVIPTQVFTGFAAPRLDTSVRLNGFVNPEGGTPAYPLFYTFEYSEDGGNTWIDLPTQEYTEGAREQIVLGQELTGLTPSTTYSFRFSAENAAGEAAPQGEVKTFATRSSAEIADPGRGIELVNQPDKGNQNLRSIVDFSATNPMLPDGDGAIWTVFGGAPGGTTSSRNVFLSSRENTGWQSQGLIPPTNEQVGGGDLPYYLEKATPDFEHLLFSVGEPPNTVVRIDREGNQDVLATYSTAGAGANFAVYSEMTDDGAHVLFVNRDTKQLEDIGDGTPEVVSLMPGGSPSQCGLDTLGQSFGGPSAGKTAAGANWSPGYRMMDTATASRVYFEVQADGECAGPYGLYMRNRDANSTTLVDPGSFGGNVNFIRSTSDGRHAFFATRSVLSATDENTTYDVYRWDEPTDTFSCLTCAVLKANVSGSVLLSDDFSHLYFKSPEQLVPGMDGETGDKTYVLSEGEIRFVGGPGIAPLGLELGGASSVLSADGDVLLFVNRSQRPDFTADKFSATCRNPSGLAVANCEQLFIYDDKDGSTECISCVHGELTTTNVGSEGSNGNFAMSRDGSTVGFVTSETLVRRDINQGADVYEWRNGVVRLITNGMTEFPKEFAAPAVRGVSEDGQSVLFMAASLLTGFEHDGLLNLYEARIGGGFEPPAPPVPCSGEACQGPLREPPPARTVSSATYRGYGNTSAARRRCARGKVRRGGRCLSKRALAGRACREKRGSAKRRCVKRLEHPNRNQGRHSSLGSLRRETRRAK